MLVQSAEEVALAKMRASGARGRAQLRKNHLRDTLTIICETPPGTSAYRRQARSFMPVEIRLGDDVSSFDQVRWCPGQEGNGFFLIMGSSGAGKTETLKLIGQQILEHGIPVLVLDFHGDVKVPWLPSVLMSSGTASWVGVNPMELDSHRAEEVGLYDQRMALLDLIERAIPGLGHHQRTILGEAIDTAYRQVGIREEDPETWLHQPPTFAQVLAILRQWVVAEEWKSRRPSILGCVAAVETAFGHPLFSRARHLPMEEILETGVRLDLSRVSDGVRYMVADTVLRKLFRMLSLLGPIPVEPESDLERFRLFVIIDEAKIMAGLPPRPNDAGLMINILVTEARKFGVGLILASQMQEHLGAEVRANTSAWLVLRQIDWHQVRKNAADIGVAPDDLAQLKGKGDGFFRSQNGQLLQRVQVRRM